MAVYATQLQPYEEHQSPSPTETNDNPYELALAPRRTSSLQAGSSGPPSPQATINTLHSTLHASAPESPPPAWKRRTTVSGRPSSSTGSASPTSPTSPTSTAGAAAAGTPGAWTVRSPSDVGPRSSPSPSAPTLAALRSTTSPSTLTPPSRRHPSLAMTAAAARVPATSLPNGLSVHESPSASSTSLGLGEGLTLPNPAFRRGASGGGNSSSGGNSGGSSAGGGGGSARSSIISTQDLNSLTSEELWAIGHGGEEVPDMSNPSRQAAERPLDTVRRMSRMVDSRPPVGYQSGLPGDVIWPAAPPVLEDAPPIRAKSTTNVPGTKRMSIRGRSRRPSADSTVSPHSLPRTKGIQSVPVSPVSNTKQQQQVMLSSAHSSSTSLSSHQTGGGLPSNKSFPAVGKQPPSTYYSRDFLSSLAPREGGYAIAAQMGGGLGAQGTMAVGDKRRSSYADVADPRSRSASSRAPLAKSAGMGRWSLDGGENFGRPYATPSAATTSSNLSAPPLTSNISDRDSVSLNDPTPTVPDGAQLPIPTPHGAASVPVSVPGSASASGSVVGSGSVPTNAQAPRTPPNPSPLSQQTSAEDVQPGAPAAPSAAAPAAAPALLTKKSKKQLAKETKAAEKLEAQKVARQRAEAARAELQKKQRAREEEQRAKEEAKRREKDNKARRKAAKKAGKSGAVPAPADLARKAPVAGAGQTVLDKQAQQAAEAGPKAEPIPVPQPAAVAMPGAPLAPGASAPPSVQASTTETDLPAPASTTATGTGSSTPTSSATSFPQMGAAQPQPQIRSSQSAYKVPTKEPLEASTRPSRASMPAGLLLSSEKTQPQAQAAQGDARPKMEVKPKRSFFGTLKKRLSYMGSGDKDGAGLKSSGNGAPPVPALPAAAAKREAPAPAAEATEFGQVPASVATSAQEGELVSPPPRRTSLMALPRHLPPVDTPSKPLSEDVLEAADESPATIRPPAHARLPVPSTPTPSTELPEAAAEPAASPSPAGSVGRTRTSLIGPRPVPARKTSGSRSRSTSINNATSSSGSGAGAGAGLAGSVVDNSPLPMPITPSTSGESALSYVQSHASHNSSMTPVTSPSDTEAESRKPSGEAERERVPFSLGEEVQVPERESSKSSDETVLPERAGQGVLA